MDGTPSMDRAMWLSERRAAVAQVYDAEASTYDLHEYPAETQATWVRRVASELGPGAVLLDAPCGTGRYFPIAADAGVRVVGVDHSAGMLERARARGIAERLERTSLQDIAEVEAFDGAITVDAMENVPPEDWPGVVANLRRALKPGAPWYLTVEEIDEAHIEDGYQSARRAGLPAVRGEVVEGDVAGYHYYPGRDRALGWLASASLSIEDETSTWHDEWGYRHFLVRRG